jgi:hypothetical protein
MRQGVEGSRPVVVGVWRETFESAVWVMGPRHHADFMQPCQHAAWTGKHGQPCRSQPVHTFPSVHLFKVMVPIPSLTIKSTCMAVRKFTWYQEMSCCSTVQQHSLDLQPFLFSPPFALGLSTANYPALPRLHVCLRHTVNALQHAACIIRVRDVTWHHTRTHTVVHMRVYSCISQSAQGRNQDLCRDIGLVGHFDESYWLVAARS